MFVKVTIKCQKTNWLEIIHWKIKRITPHWFHIFKGQSGSGDNGWSNRSTTNTAELLDNPSNSLNNGNTDSSGNGTTLAFAPDPTEASANYTFVARLCNSKLLGFVQDVAHSVSEAFSTYVSTSLCSLGKQIQNKTERWRRQMLEKNKLEIWPQRPRYFAAAITIHHSEGVACQWGVAHHI